MAEASSPGPDGVRAGSDSGVELALTTVDGGYTSGLESLACGGGTSCESSLQSFSGDLTLHNLELGKASPSSSLSPSLPSPGCQSLSLSLSAPKLMTSSLKLPSKRSESKTSSCKSLNTRRSEPRSLSQSRMPTLDDGRWPSVNSRAAKKSAGAPSNTERRSQARQERVHTTQQQQQQQQQQSTLDKYATLPRKARHVKVTAPVESGPRSLIGLSTVSREPSLNRAASLRRQRNAPNHSASSGYRSDAEDVSGSSVRSKSLTRCLPSYPGRRKRPTTLKDVGAQTVRTDPRSPEDMEAQLLELTAEHDKLSREVDISIKSLLKEKEARQKLQDDVETANKRMLQMLGRDATAASQTNLLAEIETRLTATAEVAAKNHKELSKAQKAHRTLTEEVEKAKEAASMSNQQYLDLQEESNELIDFLTAEKTTLAESLKEAEDKIVNLIAQIETKDKDIERQKDECRHLVKLSEQRRQEIQALQAKLQSTERLLVSQGGTTTAASVALDELCSRLESLLPFSELKEQHSHSPSPAIEANSSSDDKDKQRPLVGSESLQDLTKAIISCQSSLEPSAEPEEPTAHSPTLTDQASELDKLVSKVSFAFQNIIKQREQSAKEANDLKLKLESEKKALIEANLQLEEKQHKMQQLEAAQRLAHKTSTDEISTLKAILNEKENQISLKSCKENSNLLANWKVAAEELNRQYLVIDKALDVLHKEQDFVNKNPELAKLQAELEETNFRCVTLPALVPEELVTNGGSKRHDAKISPSVHVPETVNGTA
ncbi:early endosome antigen 1 isoform X2 [Neocloeon triangulifer]|uniref:early endosome antigen 1 isoform X2 n=1 Tax=Neocloeon triangulifer TaxID=2078957 RepID=UPI00286F79E7|nr:early endosome antigen 1 isoform X2 [Neocloeon triangulifer]